MRLNSSGRADSPNNTSISAVAAVPPIATDMRQDRGQSQLLQALMMHDCYRAGKDTGCHESGDVKLTIQFSQHDRLLWPSCVNCSSSRGRSTAVIREVVSLKEMKHRTQGQDPRRLPASLTEHKFTSKISLQAVPQRLHL